jgi:PKD repeat protein
MSRNFSITIKSCQINIFIKLLCLLAVFLITACDDSSNHNNKTGSVSLQIQWPAQLDILSSQDQILSYSNMEESDSNDPKLEFTLPDKCIAWGVATLALEVRDDSGNLLISKNFDCDQENITLDLPTGSGQIFSANGLDAQGAEILHGETETVIESGANSVTIELKMASTDPVVMLLSPPGGRYSSGQDIIFSGAGLDAKDGTLTGRSLVWTSSLDGEIGKGTSFILNNLSEGKHTITLTAINDKKKSRDASIDIEITFNLPPTLLSLNADPTEYQAPFLCTFTADAFDEDGTIRSYFWDFGDGNSKTTSSGTTDHLYTEGGEFTAVCTVTDYYGLTDTGSILITVTLNTPPTVELLSPSDGAIFLVGSELTFTGSAKDTYDDPDELTYIWESSLDGQISAEPSFTTNALSIGVHIITLAVTDTNGASTEQLISIIINSPPTAAITSPENGRIYLLNDEILFSGSGEDTEDNTLPGDSLVWTSSIEGQIGTGTSFSTSTLKPGIHTVTLTVTDSYGAFDTTSITIIINQPPTASITSPKTGDIYSVYEEILFSGTGEDPEDGPLTGGSLVWTSDLDHNFGTGESFSTNSLSAGKHTITLTAIDSHMATVIDSIILYIIGARLPDTGQTECFDDSLTITCPAPGDDFYGQDGSYLFIINAPSYTKLNAEGNGLPDNAETWSMVSDNNTRLIWAVKTDDESHNDMDNIYTWQNAQDVFIAGLNAADFGGYSDWRLPTVMELSTIIDAGNYYPAINEQYFIRTVGYGVYWTATEFINNTADAWAVALSSGDCDNHQKDENLYAYAVRGAQFHTGRFIDNGDGTVTDTATGLMWQQFSGMERSWKAALSYCENFRLAGYADWRLPNKNELQSLVDYSKYSPAIDTLFFPDTQSDKAYWTSTTYYDLPDRAWAVNFLAGWLEETNIKGDMDNPKYVRAVRNSD